MLQFPIPLLSFDLELQIQSIYKLIFIFNMKQITFYQNVGESLLYVIILNRCMAVSWYTIILVIIIIRFQETDNVSCTVYVGATLFFSFILDLTKWIIDFYYTLLYLFSFNDSHVLIFFFGT